jgi:hypothetical protein
MATPREITAPPVAWGLGRAWLLRAACQGADPELFFPNLSSRIPKLTQQARTRAPKALCATCPVLPHCRRHVDRLERGQGGRLIFGVWAGETPDERIGRRRTALLRLLAKDPKGQAS